MHIFYTPDITDRPTYTLNEEESQHCQRVLRLGIGDTVNLVDGKGTMFVAAIISVTKKTVVVEITNRQEQYGKRDYRLHIAIAPTKNIERFEWFLEKATEIGVDEISPICCEHSERKIIKEDRLNKIIIAAMKQSLKAYRPQLNPLRSISDLLKAETSPNKLIAHCVVDEERKFIADLVKPAQSYLVLIGPEGDFSAKEIALALKSGCRAVTLGASRLRTETAGLAACFELNHINR